MHILYDDIKRLMCSMSRDTLIALDISRFLVTSRLPSHDIFVRNSRKDTKLHTLDDL